jgi:hypothetical protein
MNVEELVEWKLGEVLGETNPSATLSTTNPIWSYLGSKPGRRGGKPATNSLSYGTASIKLSWLVSVVHLHFQDNSPKISNFLRQYFVEYETKNMAGV